MDGISDTQAAYIAGIIDGEGAIGIYTITYPHRKFLRLTFQVSMSHEPTISCIAKSLKLKYYTYFGTDKPKHQITLASMGRIKIILERLLPYLITKKEQAKIAIDYIDSRQKRMYLSNDNRQYNDFERECYGKLKRLNSSASEHA